MKKYLIQLKIYTKRWSGKCWYEHEILMHSVENSFKLTIRKYHYHLEKLNICFGYNVKTMWIIHIEYEKDSSLTQIRRKSYYLFFPDNILSFSKNWIADGMKRNFTYINEIW